MATTIQISDSVKATLDKMKVYKKETYNEVIEFILEDSMELSAQTKKELEEAEGRMDNGKSISHEDAKKRLGF